MPEMSQTVNLFTCDRHSGAAATSDSAAGTVSPMDTKVLQIKIAQGKVSSRKHFSWTVFLLQTKAASSDSHLKLELCHPVDARLAIRNRSHDY